MPEKIICPFCDSIESEYWHTNTSMADHLPYKILRCRACKSAFVSPYPTEEYLNQFYSGEVNSHGGVLKNGNPEEHLKHIMKVEKAYPNSSIDAERIASLCKSFSLGNDFLDIGAGYGFFTKAAKAIGFNCKAIEAGSNNCNVFRLMNGFERKIAIDLMLFCFHKCLNISQTLRLQLSNSEPFLSLGGFVLLLFHTSDLLYL